MKRLVWSGFFSVVVMINSCKPLHDRRGRDPVSDTERAVSDDGTLLTAMAGKTGGVCMLQSSVRNPDQDIRLLTPHGALSEKQLKKNLRFMGYTEQIATIIVGAVGAGAAGAGLVSGSVPAVAIGLTAFVSGSFGYRIVKGNIEGERAAPIAVQTIFASLVGSPIVEYFQRKGRLHKVLSDKEEYKFTDKKMRKLIYRLRDTTPDYMGGCDHIKADLRKSQ